MKVFLSWSGPKSKAVAEILRDWLPNVIQALKPWMSSQDIDKGAAWDSEIAANLVEAKAGIVCITPENQAAPWLNFEAGALSRTVTKPMVGTYLVGLKQADVIGPLSRFQWSEVTRKTHESYFLPSIRVWEMQCWLIPNWTKLLKCGGQVLKLILLQFPQHSH